MYKYCHWLERVIDLLQLCWVSLRNQFGLEYVSYLSGEALASRLGRQATFLRVESKKLIIEN